MDKTSNLPQTPTLQQTAVISWVATSERLPEIGETTDIYITSGYRVTNYKWEDYDLQSIFMPHEITHWIKIPEPPCR
jgi:hypothetical protein